MTDSEKSREITVAVIESDILMRQILYSMLRKEPGVRVTTSSGFAGSEAHVQALNTYHTDLLLLSVERADCEAMKFFYRLRKEYPEVNIVLLTPLCKEGAAVALEGLKHGAIDYITKPDKRKGLILASRHFYKRVLPLVKAVPRLNRIRLIEGKTETDYRSVTGSFTKDYPRVATNGIELIVIGSCLGGITSLYKLIAGLPGNLRVPVLIVQHMPKIYTEHLAEDLDAITPLNVREAKNSSVLLPGQVYVAPGGYHSVIKTDGCRKRIFLNKGPREHKCRPSIDVLLRSALQNYGSRMLTVFLSGGGTDGVRGAYRLLESNAKVLLESRESSLLWDSNEKIYGLKPGIEVFPANQLADEIIKRVQPAGKKGAAALPDEHTRAKWIV